MSLFSLKAARVSHLPVAAILRSLHATCRLDGDTSRLLQIGVIDLHFLQNVLASGTILHALVHLGAHASGYEQRMIWLVSRTRDGSIGSVIERSHIVMTSRVVVTRVSVGAIICS